MKLLTTLASAVAAQYQGDGLAAGVVISHLEKRDGIGWYVSIVRYPKGRNGPKVVEAKAYADTFPKAVRDCALAWLPGRDELAGLLEIL